MDGSYALQGRRKVGKSGVASCNLVGINCPPPLVEIGFTDLPKSARRPRARQACFVVICLLVMQIMAWLT
jgi:hypothetical protein